jgi:hypothetical protein
MGNFKLGFGAAAQAAAPPVMQALMQKQQVAREQEQTAAVQALDLATKTAAAGDYDGGAEIMQRLDINKKTKGMLTDMYSSYSKSLQGLNTKIKASTTKATTNILKAAQDGDHKAYSNAVMAAIADPNVSSDMVKQITTFLDPMIDPQKKAEAQKAETEALYAPSKQQVDIIKAATGAQANLALEQKRLGEERREGLEFDKEQIADRFFGGVATQPGLAGGAVSTAINIGTEIIYDIPPANQKAYDDFMRIYYKKAKTMGPGEDAIQATKAEFLDNEYYTKRTPSDVIKRMGGPTSVTPFQKELFKQPDDLTKEINRVLDRIDAIKTKSRRK